jgi:hypothetical protein
MRQNVIWSISLLRATNIGRHRTKFNRHSDAVPELCALLCVCVFVFVCVCVCACITYITRNHQPAYKVPELWSFHGWYSSSAWGQLPVATSLSDPPSPPSPRSNPTDRPTNMWLRRYSVGDPPRVPGVRASQSVRPAARHRQYSGAKCYCVWTEIHNFNGSFVSAAQFSVQTWRGLTKPAAKCRLRLNYKLNLQNEQGLSYIYYVRLLSAVRAPCYQDVLPLDNNLFLFFFLPFFPIRPPSGSLFLYICMQMALSYDVTSSGLLNISGDSERTFCLRNIHPSYTASRPWWLQSSRSPQWDRRFHMPSTDMSSPTQPSGHYTYHQFNIHQFYVLSTQFIYLFCADLKTNSDYFPIQH